MKQYKLPLTVNKGRRKRAAPESIETAIEDNNGTFPEKGFSLIEKLTE